jgi:hypothetical protein
MDGKHYLPSLSDDNNSVRKKSRFDVHHQLQLPISIGIAVEAHG